MVAARHPLLACVDAPCGTCPNPLAVFLDAPAARLRGRCGLAGHAAAPVAAVDVSALGGHGAGRPGMEGVAGMGGAGRAGGGPPLGRRGWGEGKPLHPSTTSIPLPLLFIIKIIRPPQISPLSPSPPLSLSPPCCWAACRLRLGGSRTRACGRCGCICSWRAWGWQAWHGGRGGHGRAGAAVVCTACGPL